MWRWVTHAMLPISAVLLTLVVLEGVVRVGGFGFIWGACSGCLVSHPNPRLRYVPRANYRGYETGARVATDALGLRSTGRTTPARRRILMLGDSMVFGFGVEDEQTMPRYLAVLINQALGTDVEVLNAGVNGYETEQEFERGNELLEMTAADAVVVVFIANDIEAYPYIVDSGGNLRGLRYRETGQECRPTSFANAVELALLKHSQLYNMVRFAWKLWRIRGSPAVSDEDSLGSKYVFTDAHWNRWTARLDRAQAMAERWKIPVAFLVVSVDLPNRQTHDRVLHELTVRGFQAWSTLPEFGIF